MNESADVIVVGAGVQGASVAFHLARRGVDVLVLERSAVASGATGRSSGFVRMHYDLEAESRLAWAAYPYFRNWATLVGSGDCGFVQTGFVQLVVPGLVENMRANVAAHRRIGVPTSIIGPDDVARLLPGIVTDDIIVAAYEPGSGYADPAATATGFLAAARAHGARFIQGCHVDRVLVEGGRVAGVETDRGRFSAGTVVNVAGAWAGELARTAGLDVPVQAWRHDTAYFGLPDGHDTQFPIVIDDINGAYFRPEGQEMMLVGLESRNEIGGSPDRPLGALHDGAIEDMVTKVCERVPWMSGGTLRTSHGGQDGITPDQRAIIDKAGPDGFYLVCGMSAPGFKTAPAIGAGMAEWILDGQPSTVDLSAFTLRRFAEGRPLIGEHPYDLLWR